MDLIVSFILYVGSMIFCLSGGETMIYALLLGLVLFAAAGMRRGFSLKAVLEMGCRGVRETLLVAMVMLIIGMITGIWRSSGTIAFFVYYGIQSITPHLFLLVAFFLSSLLSYALGTAFGVSATAGVTFMALARTGGVNPVIAAGVIMSGVYFGDRNAPVSSSLILIAGITKTDILKNVKHLLKAGAVPFLLTAAFYLFLSVKNPLNAVDGNFAVLLKSQFDLSPAVGLPALLMLVLPLLKVRVRRAMMISILSAALVGYFLQGRSPSEILRAIVLGYRSPGPLSALMDGGGMVSMLEVEGIIFLSSMYSGIFEGTQMLKGLQEEIRRWSERAGRFAVMIVTSLLTASLFCNQTIASMMVNDLHRRCYSDGPEGDFARAMDMEDSVVVLSGLVPWAISATVPLAFMEADYRSLAYASLLYLIPLWHWFRESRTAA